MPFTGVITLQYVCDTHTTVLLYSVQYLIKVGVGGQIHHAARLPEPAVGELPLLDPNNFIEHLKSCETMFSTLVGYCMMYTYQKKAKKFKPWIKRLVRLALMTTFLAKNRERSTICYNLVLYCKQGGKYKHMFYTVLE